jgi:surface antigen, putative
MDKNGRTNLFLGWAAVLMLAASVLFTACPNATKTPESPTPMPEYTPVAYDKLAEYLANTASTTEINKIEVTGLEAKHLKGDDFGYPPKPSPLGAILQAHPTKKVALKLGGSVSALMDMPFCFYGCKSLVRVTAIPKGVKDMTGCFDSCTSLTQAPVLPESVTKMTGCFRDCTSLTKAPAIPKGVDDMKSCFASCTSLKEAPAIPKDVKDLKSCFASCINLTQAPAIPEGVKDMSYCFQNCTSLTKAPASIPASVENMSQCFENCTSLTEAPASIPASVKDMSQCFQKCTSLTQGPAISEGVEDMKACFWGCTSLTEVPAIPASVTEMSGCFLDCEVLTSVTLKCNYGDGKFVSAFKSCIALGEKSIKVPQAYYGNYTTAKALHSMVVPGTTEAEKKAKFEGLTQLNP